ncbi:ribonuclease H-like domain-containing protein [Tanacetum coccineum]
MMGIPNEHQLKFNSIKDAKKLLEAVEKRFGGNAATRKTQRNLLKQQYKNFTEMIDQTLDRLQKLNTHAVVWRNKADLDTISMDDLYNNLKVYETEVKGMSSSSSSTQNMAFVSSSNNNTSSTNGAVSTAHGVSTASTQVNDAYSTNIDNLSEAVICTFFSRRKLTVNGNETISFDKSKVECYNCHKRGHFARECRAPRNQDNKNKESSRRSVPSDQAEEGPNYALMAFLSSSSDSEVSNNSICLKSCLETVELLKSQNDQLLKDLKKSELMVLGYKTGLESVEEKLEVYKANESIYLQDIKGLKFEIHIGEITIRELRKKLEIVQKEKDGIQLNVDKFEHASKIPPPYTGNFMPPTPDLSFIGLDEFVNKHVVENCKAMSSKEEPKVVRKNDDAPCIEEWVSDDEEEDVSQHKTKKKTVRPSIVKKEFVKSKQQEKTARKTVKQGNPQDQGMEDMLLLEGTPKVGKSQEKGNLVRDLPSKLFENDQTRVTCQKGKQHRASCKSKKENSISLPLHLLHMDLFGLTFVKSLKKKMYCIVVTNDFSRFIWAFFLATKDDTSGILKSFISEIENIVDHKVKVIRCDNGTEFKNREMD